MTSRMALSYPGKFRALAVVAGSWATCAGSAQGTQNRMVTDADAEHEWLPVAPVEVPGWFEGH